MCTVLLPPGVKPVAVKYIILYHITVGIRIEIRNRYLPNVNSNANEATETCRALSIINVVFRGFLSLFCLQLFRINSHCLLATHFYVRGSTHMYKEHCVIDIITVVQYCSNILYNTSL
jgi:hypothetical protein